MDVSEETKDEEKNMHKKLIPQTVSTKAAEGGVAVGADELSEPFEEDPKVLGRRGESAAARYLERQGFDILEQNWKCRYGEADIIAKDVGTIVFIEVKTRRGIEKGIPEDAVTASKRDRYEKIAASYLEQHDYVDCYVRFDVIAIMVVEHKRALLRHHRGAFSHED
jgi:putative endonuclease